MAWHLLKAGLPQAAWAVQALEEAAEQSHIDGQPELIVKCFERAYQSRADEHYQAMLNVEEVVATWGMNSHSATKYLTPIVIAVRQGYSTCGTPIARSRQSCSSHRHRRGRPGWLVLIAQQTRTNQR